MSSLHRVRLTEREPQPWRNGGGLTRELLTWPLGRPTWMLRVSVAEVAGDTPFSEFEGIERWFAVVEGAGVVLSLPRGDRAIGPDDDPVCFDGEAAPACRLVEGPTRDLNLMVRRSFGHGSLRRADPGTMIEGDTRWRGVYAAESLLIDLDGRSEVVAAGTLLWSDEHDAATWQARGRGHGHGGAPRAWWLSIAMS